MKKRREKATAFLAVFLSLSLIAPFYLSSRSFAEEDPSASLLRARAHLTSGNGLFAAGDFEGSAGEYTKALSFRPDFSQAYIGRGNANFKLGDFKEAFFDYHKAVEINPKDPDAYIGRGNARYALRDFEGSIMDYTMAIGLRPSDEAAYLNRGLARGSSGDDAGAEEDFGRAMALRPDYSSDYYKEGRMRLEKGDPSGAYSAFSKAVSLRPEDHHAYLGRGNALFKMGEHRLALSEYEKAVSLKPQDHLAYVGRGNAKGIMGDLEGALADYTKSIGLEPKDPSAYHNRALLRAKAGDLAGAEEDSRAERALLSETSVAKAPQKTTENEVSDYRVFQGTGRQGSQIVFSFGSPQILSIQKAESPDAKTDDAKTEETIESEGPPKETASGKTTVIGSSGSTEGGGFSGIGRFEEPVSWASDYVESVIMKKTGEAAQSFTDGISPLGKTISGATGEVSLVLKKTVRKIKPIVFKEKPQSPVDSGHGGPLSEGFRLDGLSDILPEARRPDAGLLYTAIPKTILEEKGGQWGDVRSALTYPLLIFLSIVMFWSFLGVLGLSRRKD